MQFNAKCWTQVRIALAAATICLSGCATADFNPTSVACPVEVDYSRAEQERIADEVATLPAGALIVGWLADYAVLRAQVRACRQTLKTY